MKLSEKIATYNAPHPFYSFEFFPPRTDQARLSISSIYHPTSSLLSRDLKISSLASPAYVRLTH